MQTLSLIDLITELGDERAATMFGVKHRTIQSWRRGERVPRTRDIPGLIARSDGRLTHASFFGPAHDHAHVSAPADMGDMAEIRRLIRALDALLRERSAA